MVVKEGLVMVLVMTEMWCLLLPVKDIMSGLNDTNGWLRRSRNVSGRLWIVHEVSLIVMHGIRHTTM